MKTSKRTSVHLLLIGLTIFAVYFNALENNFVWDDGTLILDNSLIKSWGNFSKFFVSDLHQVGDNQANFYRPLQLITLCLDYTIWKLNYRGYHFFNIFLHILVAFLLYRLTYLIIGNRKTAFLVAIFYSVHPVHTQAVAYISGRADILATYFILLALISYIYFQTRQKKLFYAASLLTFGLSLLSKEIALIFPFLLIFYDTVYNRDKLRYYLKYYSGYLIIFCIYVLLRLTVLDFSAVPAEFSLNFATRLFTAFKIIMNYFYLLLLPVNLHMEKILVPATYPFEISVFLGIVLVIVLAIFFKPILNKHKTLFFGLGWFFISIFPLLNIVRPLNAFIAEHWLYLPSLGVFLSLAYAGNRVFQESQNKSLKKSGLVLLVVILVFYLFLTSNRNKVWKNDVTLYNDILKYNTQSARVYNNLGNAYAKRRQFKKAINCYTKALKIDPNYVDTHNNLGIAYKNLGQYDKALAQYEKARRLDPNYITVYHNLGVIYTLKGRYDKAIAVYVKCIEKDPQNSHVYSNLANIYINTGLYNLAIKECKKALKLDPTNSTAFSNMGVAYLKKGMCEEAIICFKEALKIKPQDRNILKNLKVAEGTQKISKR